MLMILDGFGLRAETAGNAIAAARTPNFDRLWAEWPHATLGASGLDVGLPDGQMGNSEVGHTNIGAGRIVYQELTRITKAIQDGDFFSNPALNAAIDALDPDGTLHLMGLLSDGGVHSHNTHLYALLELAHRRGVRRVAVHSFLDGRDTDPKSGAGYLEELETEMSAYEVTDALLEALEKKDYGMIVLNYANCDMVGHTGVFEAAVRAVEAVDECLGRVVGRVLALGGVVLLTADHGNADMMQNPDGSPMTAHTTNRVPVLSIGERRKLRGGGALCDLAPTVLELLGIDPPAEMSGKSLFC